jgi:hypothetical protein
MNALYVHLHTTRPRLPSQTHLRTIAHMTKTAALSLRIEPELKTALERLAEADRRSLASYVELALQDHVERQKRTKPKG